MSYFRAIKFLDELGAAYGIKHIGNKPRVSAMPYTYDIAEDNIAGHAALYKFGFNEDVGTSFETIWTDGGLYDWVGVAAGAGLITVSSTSANDTAAGIGARTCTIYGLDLSGVEQSETITLNGTGGQISTLSYSRINRIIINSAGSVLANVGRIYAGSGTVVAGVPAVKWSVVEVGENQTLQTLWTVPSGKTFFMTSFTIATNSNKGNMVKMYFRPSGGVFLIKTQTPIFSTPFNHIFEFPLRLEAGTDIEFRGKGTATGAGIGCTFEGWTE